MHRSEPALERPETWEDIAWVTISCPAGVMSAVGLYGDGATSNFAPGPGLLRVRCSARGRDLNHRQFVDVSGERYRIDAWLVAEDAPGVDHGVVKATSKTSEYLLTLTGR